MKKIFEEPTIELLKLEALENTTAGIDVDGPGLSVGVDDDEW